MDFFHKVLQNNSRSTLVLITLAGATWLIGGNAVIAMHYRRLGKSLWYGFRNREFPFPKFTLREWCMLVIVAAISLYLIRAALPA